jgi:hypothetical protein
VEDGVAVTVFVAVVVAVTVCVAGVVVKGDVVTGAPQLQKRKAANIMDMNKIRFITTPLSVKQVQPQDRLIFVPG